MTFISVDLGTTNIKVAAYDEKLNELSMVKQPVDYLRDGDMVEFDPEDYFIRIKNLISSCCADSHQKTPYQIQQIILTGQAESLIIVDEKMKPLRNGISWLDMRSKEECFTLQERFSIELCHQITGQPEIIPTWPITKILWIKKNEPNVFIKTHKFMLLKDYIQYRLTGKIYGEYSIYSFSHYFDIFKKDYWLEILEYCGIPTNKLPKLIEPCTVIGNITEEISTDLDISQTAKVNVGTLDHFAGMIGGGNIEEGFISESTGTVLSIATLVNKTIMNDQKAAYHYGPFKDSYVLLQTCESGGISLEWFKNQFFPQESFNFLNEIIEKRTLPNELVFLPFITGVNAPDYNRDAKGVFYGIQIKHDKYDFAYSVMEGVAHLLKINIDHIEKSGIYVDKIISTGGGSQSDIWSQIKANITGKQILIPSTREVACLGAAIIGAVSEGLVSNYQDAINHFVISNKTFLPQKTKQFDRKHELFLFLYEQLAPVFKNYKI